MGYKEIHKHPNAGINGFHKNPENINRKGRPRKVVNILKNLEYSKDDIRTVFQSLIWYTMKELKEVDDDDKNPMVMRMTANQFLSAYKKSDMNKIKELLEYILSKNQQLKVEHEIKEPINLKIYGRPD